VTSSPDARAARLADHVREIPDYPQPGVLFRDVTPLLADAEAFAQSVRALAGSWTGEAVDAVVGIEARGFIFAAPVAHHLGVGFVPVRKEGKLPAATFTECYALEYGDACLQMHRDALVAGQRVLIVDDVLATGGTAEATAALVATAGASVAGVSVLIAVAGLGGEERLAAAGLGVTAVLR
jgi:adenine phosphoribosyltransferase